MQDHARTYDTYEQWAIAEFAEARRGWQVGTWQGVTNCPMSFRTKYLNIVTVMETENGVAGRDG